VPAPRTDAVDVPLPGRAAASEEPATARPAPDAEEPFEVDPEEPEREPGGVAAAADAVVDVPVPRLGEGAECVAVVETGRLGVDTVSLGTEGVESDGVVTLGVLACGVVIGPVVIDGTVTDGTVSFGTLTVGAVVSDGSDTVGRPPDPALPSATAVDTPPDRASAPHAAMTISLGLRTPVRLYTRKQTPSEYTHGACALSTPFIRRVNTG
jgi:hypothetical protein